MTAVVLMARAPRPGRVRRALESVLGPEGCAALEAELLRAAAAWAHEVAPGAIYAAYEPPDDWISCDVRDAEAELRGLIGPDAIMFPHESEGTGARVTEAVELVLEREDGPVLVVWPDLPRLRPAHAAAALEDLSSGCELSFGPVIGGGLYLLGLTRADPRLLDLPESAWHAPDAIGMALAAGLGTEVEVGILRTERGLRQPADVQAARADPTLLPELREILFTSY